MIYSKWTGYGHNVELSETSTGFVVVVDGRITTFMGSTHSHPEQAAKTFFTRVMDDFRSKGYKKPC